MPWLIKLPSGRKGKVKRTPSIFRTLSTANQVSEWPLSDSDNGSCECDSMVIKSGDYCDTDCCCCCCSLEVSVHYRRYTGMCIDYSKAQCVTFTLIVWGKKINICACYKVVKNNFSVCFPLTACRPECSSVQGLVLLFFHAKAMTTL